MREQAFLPAGQEHGVELQPLGGVQRHDRRLLFLLAGLLHVHHQRDVLEETFHGLELVHGAHEFLQVLQPGGCLRVLVLLVHFRIAGLVQNDLRHLGVGQGVDLGAPAGEGGQQVRERLPCLVGQFFRLDDVQRGAVQRGAGGPGNGVNLLDRVVANAALRGVDDALEGEIVVWRHGDLEIGQRIADFGALIEARAADHAVRQAERDEAVLESAHLERGAHENGHFLKRGAGALGLLDVLADGAGFLVAVPVAAHPHFLAGVLVGPQCLAKAAFIVGDQAGGRAEDVGRGAVVRLQPYDARAGEVLLEAQDVVDLRPAPAIDRLVVVANAADIAVALRQQPEPQVLRHVGVLVLVHQHVLELLLVLGKHVRIFLEQAQALEQQVAEVDGVQHLQPRLIVGIELRALAVAIGGAFAGRHLVRRQAAVLPAVNVSGELAGRPALLIDALGLDELLQQAQLIVGVENREVRLQANQLGVAAKHLHAYGVEGAEPGHALDHAADEAANALLHFARGLVGEGDGEDLAGPRLALGEDVGKPGGQHPRLAGARTRQHQQRAVQRFDGGALLGVERAQVGRRGRGCGSCGDTGTGLGGCVGHECLYSTCTHGFEGFALFEEWKDHKIWLRNSRVRGSFAFLKKVAGGPCSTITPRSVK